MNVGLLQLHSDGITSLDKEKMISLHSAMLVLNDTSSSPNGATLTAATAHHQPSGQPFIIAGQDAILRGGDVRVEGGEGQGGGSIGGDVLIDGGRGKERRGGVVVGGKSEKLVLACNKTEVVAEKGFTVQSVLTTFQSPVVFNSAITSFSGPAFKAGGSFSYMALASAENTTIWDGEMGAGLSVVEGTFSDGFGLPGSGGVWAIAESCTTCVKFGAGGGFIGRHGMASMVVEGIQVKRAGEEWEGGGEVNATEEVETELEIGRVRVACGILRYEGNNIAEKVEVGGDGVEVVASTSFYKDDEYVGLSASKIIRIEPDAEYAVFCAAKHNGHAIVRASKVSLSIKL
ncbi:hypothetical protein TrRE_jg11083 [Triparma retinervis]|uniref:Uncharacterized protein n=1 Tax=Triparma retinervis TaxID=2557542 RepID=A0A9W7L372_9STRA|nr:hypothetical protein TrRE_jg11083 [Triparma retinervis]